jgi:hypothetical protein
LVATSLASSPSNLDPTTSIPLAELHRKTRVRAEAGSDTPAALPVVAAPASIEATVVPQPAAAVPHPERSNNIALLESLLDWPEDIHADISAAYDAMVNSVVATGLMGVAPTLGQTTLAVVPNGSMGRLGLSSTELGQESRAVCSIRGDTLVVVKRGETSERYRLVTENGETLAYPPDTEDDTAVPLSVLLPVALGIEFPAPLGDLLQSLEVGGEAYRSKSGEVELLADAQAGIVFGDDGRVRSLFSNGEAAIVPSGHEVLFGYHSHPIPDRRLIPDGQPIPDPRRASGPDLLAFGRRCEDVNRRVPQIVWYTNGRNRATGLIYVPTKDKYGWGAPLHPTHMVTVTV